MDDESKKNFLEALGVEEAGLNRLIKAGYKLLGLQTYFTAGVKKLELGQLERETVHLVLPGRNSYRF